MMFGDTDQKIWMYEVLMRSTGSLKTFYFLTLLGGLFYQKILTKFIMISLARNSCRIGLH
jgi:hypothetical protein